MSRAEAVLWQSLMPLGLRGRWLVPCAIFNVSTTDALAKANWQRNGNGADLLPYSSLHPDISLPCDSHVHPISYTTVLGG